MCNICYLSIIASSSEDETEDEDSDEDDEEEDDDENEDEDSSDDEDSSSSTKRVKRNEKMVHTTNLYRQLDLQLYPFLKSNLSHY